MVGKLLSLMVVILLAACSSSNESADGTVAPLVDGDGSGSGYGADGVNSGALGEITPGSQAELVATIGDRVFFDFNSAQISSSGQQTLQRQAEWLKQYSNVTVTVEGHADERGTREYNLALGERRANAVRNYLASLGVSQSRISTISYGKEHPEYLGSNEASWSKNRRGVTVVN